MLFKRLYAKVEELRRGLAATDRDNELQDDRIKTMEREIQTLHKEIAELKNRTVLWTGDLALNSSAIPVATAVRVLFDHLGLCLDRVPPQDAKVVIKNARFMG